MQTITVFIAFIIISAINISSWFKLKLALILETNMFGTLQSGGMEYYHGMGWKMEDDDVSSSELGITLLSTRETGMGGIRTLIP